MNYFRSFGACVICLVIFSLSSFSQTYYLVENPAGTISIKVKQRGVFVALAAADLKKIRIKKALRFDVSGLLAGTTFKIEATPTTGPITDITANPALVTTSGQQYIIAKTDASISILKLTATPSAGTAATFADIGKDAVGMPAEGTNVAMSYPSWRSYLEANTGGYLNIIKGKQRYFSNRNLAYICLDPFGNIIGKKPVNIDQDDDVVILIVVPNTEDYDNYSVNDNDAEYAPTDLSIRSSETITIPTIQSEEAVDVQYTVKVFEKGPYTSSDVTFTVMIANTQLNNITVHVNPLYHLGIGVSYISTNLQNPDFQIVPLTATTNTIQAANTGRRTILTANAIWYWWPTLRYLAGSSLTRGRDVLKEPNFLTRFNPTFGIGLTSDIQSNFFAGINFEFARGGSITAGWHYGKTNRLLDKDFKLGETEFNGTQADIKTENVWKWAGFFGVTLDTRIFNRLFSTATSNNQ
ncbi:MAG: hypothetical protein QM802_22940 [Agriterribacter sp.]